MSFSFVMLHENTYGQPIVDSPLLKYEQGMQVSHRHDVLAGMTKTPTGTMAHSVWEQFCRSLGIRTLEKFS